MKKAQMEILGLAIVVILILIGAVFVIRFLALKKPTEYRKGFVSSELASNMLNTFLKTVSGDCSQLTMTELLQDCAQGKNIICANQQDSCAYAKSAAETIFRSTLDQWKMRYEFLAYVNANSPLIKIGDLCHAEKKSKLFPIPISSATMYTKLDICE